MRANLGDGPVSHLEQPPARPAGWLQDAASSPSRGCSRRRARRPGEALPLDILQKPRDAIVGREGVEHAVDPREQRVLLWRGAGSRDVHRLGRAPQQCSQRAPPETPTHDPDRHGDEPGSRGLEAMNPSQPARCEPEHVLHDVVRSLPVVAAHQARSDSRHVGTVRAEDRVEIDRAAIFRGRLDQAEVRLTRAHTRPDGQCRAGPESAHKKFGRPFREPFLTDRVIPP